MPNELQRLYQTLGGALLFMSCLGTRTPLNQPKDGGDETQNVGDTQTPGDSNISCDDTRACRHNDGCCPATCVFTNDRDCEATCDAFNIRDINADQIAYIDFDTGVDTAAGSRNAPWKHHPWDPNSEIAPNLAQGRTTFIFKGGVMYTGQLIASQSGTPATPLRLLGDPTWGTGRPIMSGGQPLSGGWSLCNATTCPGVLAENLTTTWYVDLSGTFTPRLLWAKKGDRFVRIPIARYPNWKVTDQDDPRSEWGELDDAAYEIEVEVVSATGFSAGDTLTGTSPRSKTQASVRSVSTNTLYVVSRQWNSAEMLVDAQITNGVQTTTITNISAPKTLVRRYRDSELLEGRLEDAFKGAVFWAELQKMPNPKVGRVVGYEADSGTLRVLMGYGFGGAPWTFNRYFLEGLPMFLDEPGEYVFVDAGPMARRLFLRLPDDSDPNNTQVIAAAHTAIIDIGDQNNITLSNLLFTHGNTVDATTDEGRRGGVRYAALLIHGNVRGICLQNSVLRDTAAGVVARPDTKGDLMTDLQVVRNTFINIDGSAVAMTMGRFNWALRNLGARLEKVDVIKNDIRNVGMRSIGHWGAGTQGHAVDIEGGEVVELAFNTVSRSGGAGLRVYGGTPQAISKTENPLLRVRIHHNVVTDSLLALQDYGGIAAWFAGPTYIYNNVSGNPVGYKHRNYRISTKKNWYRTSSFGVGIYLDAQYKGYVFNNIIWGKNNNVNDRIYNSTGINEAAGFLHTVFHNTIYKFGVDLHKGMFQHERGAYLANLMLDTGLSHIEQEPTPQYIEYDTLAYANNIFHGTTHHFGKLAAQELDTLEAWQNHLKGMNAMLPDTGRLSSGDLVRNASAHDFTPTTNSDAIDGGVKVFVPWSLYGVAGEWHFLHHPAAPSVIVGEHLFITDEWLSREMAADIPRHDLNCVNVGSTDFRAGLLEDWIPGALRFNGQDQFCSITNTELRADYDWQERGNKSTRSGTYPGNKRRGMDMDTNDFIIEMVLRISQEQAPPMPVLNKMDNLGYAVRISSQGRVEVRLTSTNNSIVRTSILSIADGAWHHVLIEVDRKGNEVLRIYIDGVPSQDNNPVLLPASASLSNTADFLVGKDSLNFFSGDMDFLRVARGTLKSARTTIDELYAWEFDGPFLRDFNDQPPVGNGRDVGAIEAPP